MGLYFRPRSLNEALEALTGQPAGAAPRVILAGGTDHFPARVIENPVEDVVDISGLPDCSRIEVEADGAVTIPCLCTWTDLIEADLPPHLDCLIQAARQVGGVQIQNAGTVVGNVCNASPAADGIPCLTALDAEVILRSVEGTRHVLVAEFVSGARRTLRRPDELVTAIRVPSPRTLCVRSRFEKLGARRYLVISIVMVACVIRLDEQDSVAQVRIAVGACTPSAVRLIGLERELAGMPFTSLSRGMVKRQHLAPLAPIADIRGSGAYRMAAALELARRAVAGRAGVDAKIAA